MNGFKYDTLTVKVKSLSLNIRLQAGNSRGIFSYGLHQFEGILHFTMMDIC